MSIADFARKLGKITSDNSPAILTAIGVTGTITTAYLAGRASFKAHDVIRREETKRNLENSSITREERIHIETRERFALVWTLYIPAVGTGVMTVSAIIMANRIGMRRTAAMASMYAISERALSEYKDKVHEKFGATKAQQVRDEIVQDRVNQNPPNEREVIVTGNGDVLCKDEFSGRYFRSSMEELKKAQNDLNYQVIHSDYATLSDLYDKLGLEHTSNSDDVGWNTDKPLEMHFSTALTPDGQPCISYEFGTMPMRFPGHLI